MKVLEFFLVLPMLRLLLAGFALSACDGPPEPWDPTAPELSTPCPTCCDGGANCCDTEAQIVCDPPLRAGGHSYMYCKTEVSATRAAEHCEMMDYHLATVTSGTENKYIRELVDAPAWVGASDAASEGNWVWITGEGATYQSWADGEPNNTGGQDCAVIAPSGEWFDESCDDENNPFVCEIEDSTPYKETRMWNCLICETK